MALIAKQTYIAGTHNVNIEVLDVAGIPVEQITLKAGGAIKAGAPVRINTSGQFIEAIGTDTTTNDAWGIAIRTCAAGQGCTAVKRGALGGFDFSSLAFSAKIYVSDTVGRLGDVAGTASKVVGRVFPYGTNTPGGVPTKVLYVEL